MIKKIPQMHQFLQPKLLRSHYGQSASESAGAPRWCAQMQGLLPWTGSFSLMKSDRQSRVFQSHNWTNMYFNSSVGDKVREVYLSCSPIHGSWNIEKAATMDPRPTVRTTPAPLCWRKIIRCNNSEKQ